MEIQHIYSQLVDSDDFNLPNYRQKIISSCICLSFFSILLFYYPTFNNI